MSKIVVLVKIRKNLLKRRVISSLKGQRNVRTIELLFVTFKIEQPKTYNKIKVFVGTRKNILRKFKEPLSNLECPERKFETLHSGLVIN